jgi:hypothetical protein
MKSTVCRQSTLRAAICCATAWYTCNQQRKVSSCKAVCKAVNTTRRAIYSACSTLAAASQYMYERCCHLTLYVEDDSVRWLPPTGDETWGARTVPAHGMLCACRAHAGILCSKARSSSSTTTTSPVVTANCTFRPMR